MTLAKENNTAHARVKRQTIDPPDQFPRENEIDGYVYCSGSMVVLLCFC